MSELAIEITGFVAGDDLEIRRTVTDLPAAITLAWLSLKRYPGLSDDDAKLQKRITTTAVPGIGHIEDAGGAETDGILRFDLTAADTTALAVQNWVFDIQIKLASDKVYTIEKGRLQMTADVTRSTT